MPTRFNRLVFQAVAGGVDLSELCTEATITFDLSRRVSECSLKLIEWPTGVNFWDELSVSAGLDASYVPVNADDPPNHGALQRFAGFVWDPSLDLWPPSRTMQGRGPLILAERQRVHEDEEYEYAGIGYPSPSFIAPGIDMSVDPATVDPADPLSGTPWTAQEMITYVLNSCGLSGRIGSIGGLPHLLGLTAPDKFVWRRQQSGLEFIEEIDKIGLGFRTYELPPCCAASATQTIYRTRISMLPNPADVQATFWEGRDLFAGSALSRNPSLIRNCVRVSGYNPGSYPQTAVAVAEHPVPPPGITNPLDTEYFESDKIELDVPDGTNEGLSAREVADWLIGERRYDWHEVNAVTWRDDAIGAGKSIYVNAPHMGGDIPCNQAFWVQSVTIKVGPGAKFRQELKLRAPNYWAGEGSVLGSLSLGTRIG